MDADEGFEDEGPFSPWVPPDDRLWRHPSEAAGGPPPLHAPSAAPARGFTSHTWTTALIAGVIGALLASGIGLATGGFGRTTVIRPYATLSTPPTTVTEAAASVQPPTSWSAIYTELAPSMVMISGNGEAGAVSTSGMLWETNPWGTAYILSADKALAGVSRVNVTMAGGATARGQVIGTDSQSGIAVIAVSQKVLPGGGAFPQLGPLSDVTVGDALATVGSGTDSTGSFVTGSVSSLDRAVTDSDNGVVMVGMIAVANAGAVNYGTAVVDTSGDVVGLTVEGPDQDGAPLVSYAIPMDLASIIATQIINGQRPWHPWIGIVQAEDLPSITATQMNLLGGAQVDEVSSGSPAAKAGVGAHDIVVGLANSPINSTADLLNTLSQCNPNSRVSLRYLHQGKTVNTSITVVAQPANP